MSNDFKQMATFYLPYETHGGEDVSAYAIGPQAHLISGVHEQSYLAHLVAYAACIREDTLSCPKGNSNEKQAVPRSAQIVPRELSKTKRSLRSTENTL